MSIFWKKKNKNFFSLGFLLIAITLVAPYTPSHMVSRFSQRRSQFRVPRGTCARRETIGDGARFEGSQRISHIFWALLVCFWFNLLFVFNLICLGFGASSLFYEIWFAWYCLFSWFYGASRFLSRISADLEWGLIPQTCWCLVCCCLLPPVIDLMIYCRSSTSHTSEWDTGSQNSEEKGPKGKWNRQV